MVWLRLHTTYLFLLLLICINIQAQTPEIIWEHGFGGSNDDRAMDIIETLDGGLLTIGYSNSFDGDIDINFGQRDFLVIKTNTEGETLWKKSFGGSGNDYCNSVCIANDGGYMLVGETWSADGEAVGSHGATDFLVIKIDEVGEIIWSKCFGGSNYEGAQSIFPTSDGNYLIGGFSNSEDGNVSEHIGSLTYTDFWLIKISDAGDLIWEKNYGSTLQEYINAVIELTDGNYLITGYTSGYNGDVTANYGNADYWVVKISNDGEIIWENSFGGSDTDIAHDVIESPTGSLYCIGETYSEDGLIPDSEGFIDTWIIKIDPISGDLLDSYNFGGPDADPGRHIVQVNENELVFTASSQSVGGDITTNNGESDYWLVSIDTFGNINWQKSVGGSNFDIPYALTYTSDSNFVISGISYSTDFDVTETYTGYNFWVVKMGQCSNLYFADLDLDGFGDLSSDSIACNIPLGYVTDSTDCDDTNPAIHPTLTDICNTIDDNCNGITDEDAIFITYFLDNDGDLFGNALMDSTSCNVLIGYVENSLDCDDENPDINPLAVEICNAIDDNCNTDIDEGLTIYTLYADADGDTYGNPDALIDTCIESIFGYVTNSLDCNDTLASVYPGATELCNYIDDDCDGLSDENLTYILSYQDADSDDYGNPLVDSLSCDLPAGYILDNTDCDDTNPLIYPGAEELLNGLDDDCDQVADEGLSVDNLNNTACTIFPNPAFDIVNIVSNINGNGRYEIISATGQIILLGDWDASKNSISIFDIPAGAYTVRLSFNESVKSLMLIKIN
jgi:hypothetical protein